jgi:hypothetical protein
MSSSPWFALAMIVLFFAISTPLVLALRSYNRSINDWLDRCERKAEREMRGDQ